MRKICTFAAIAAATFAVGQARATEIMPSFAGAPAGWTVDRYAPDSFTDVGAYMGRSNVLGIGISSAQGALNRPAGQQAGFYSTQGMNHPAVGGVGDTLSAYLYIPKTWSDPINGSVRTDMWGVMTDGASITDYPILGFTNYGTGSADLNSAGAHDSFIGLRAFDENLNGNNGGWVDLSAPVKYDSWNELQIKLTGADIDYFINGALAYTEENLAGSTDFSETIMQAFNFDGDPNSPGSNFVPYTAHWANAVPEPGTIALFASGLLFLGFCSRQRSLRFSKAA